MADNLLAHVPRSIVLSERLVALTRGRAVSRFEEERLWRSGSHRLQRARILNMRGARKGGN